MSLPKVTIKFLNGQIGTVPQNEDGMLALVCSGTVVSTTFQLGTPYVLKRYASLDALGITPVNNPGIDKLVKEFYSEASEGTPLVLFGYDSTKTMTEICDKETGPLPSFLISQNGKIRGIVVARYPGSSYKPNVDEGIDPDVFSALPKAQALAEWVTEERYAPIFCMLEGRSFDSVQALKDLSKMSYNRVGVFIGNTEARKVGEDNKGTNAAMGLLAGRIASSPVQRNIGRVKDGSLHAEKMYIGAKPVEESMDDIDTIYTKGYITPRIYVGRSGYFFTDDSLACAPTDDYSHLALRRVIDKAYRICYQSMAENILDEIYVNEDGTMQTAVIKSWQASVEDAINSQMTANGELSADLISGESGCSCHIDETQNVLATSMIEMTVKVRPFGYGRFFNINLGFQVNTLNS